MLLAYLTIVAVLRLFLQELISDQENPSYEMGGREAEGTYRGEGRRWRRGPRAEGKASRRRGRGRGRGGRRRDRRSQSPCRPLFLSGSRRAWGDKMRRGRVGCNPARPGAKREPERKTSPGWKSASGLSPGRSLPNTRSRQPAAFFVFVFSLTENAALLINHRESFTDQIRSSHYHTV
jgi:hypothetical protein